MLGIWKGRILMMKHGGFIMTLPMNGMQEILLSRILAAKII